MTNHPLRRPIATVRTLRKQPAVPAMPKVLFLEPQDADGQRAVGQDDDPEDDAA